MTETTNNPGPGVAVLFGSDNDLAAALAGPA